MPLTERKPLFDFWTARRHTEHAGRSRKNWTERGDGIPFASCHRRDCCEIPEEDKKEYQAGFLTSFIPV
jgi:hypothetical protein